MGVGKKELRTCLVNRVAIGRIMRIFIWAMDRHCARHCECGNCLDAMAVSKYITLDTGTANCLSSHRAEGLTTQIKMPKLHGLLNQFQNAGQEARGKKWVR